MVLEVVPPLVPLSGVPGAGRAGPSPWSPCPCRHCPSARVTATPDRCLSAAMSLCYCQRNPLYLHFHVSVVFLGTVLFGLFWRAHEKCLITRTPLVALFFLFFYDNWRQKERHPQRPLATRGRKGLRLSLGSPRTHRVPRMNPQKKKEQWEKHDDRGSFPLCVGFFQCNGDANSVIKSNKSIGTEEKKDKGSA